MVTSNTKDCFREFVGRTVKGVLFSIEVGRDSKMLIFDDGRGLAFASNGSFWIESVEDVKSAISRRARELTNLQNDLADVIALARIQNE